MRFDSHVTDLLKVAAGLVNAQCCREAGGRPTRAAQGTALQAQLGRVLVRDTREPFVSTSDVHVLARFATDARAVFEAAADEDFDAAAAASNRLSAWTKPAMRLARHGDSWDLHFHGITDQLGDGWAAGCAAALAMALGSPGAGRLGVCAAHACDRVYVDRSKNNTRVFCSTTCQNRVKNARHRDAHTTATTPATGAIPAGQTA